VAAAEVHAFDQQVGSDDEIVRGRAAQDGRVVADADEQGRGPWASRRVGFFGSRAEPRRAPPQGFQKTELAAR
jgi:hypothetical protein